MNVLIAISAILALVGLMFLGSMVRHVRRGRLLRAGGSATACAASAGLGTAGILIFMSYLGYERLTDEQLVGVIEFSQSAAEEYTARLMIDDQIDRLLTLRGDEWQLDARVVTWSPPATILGLEPVYQLERLSGRYSSVDRERSEQRTVHGLAEERPLDLWSLARKFPRFAPGVDAFYGTATYLPMADGARYRVTLSRDALIARPINDQARNAVGDWGRVAE
ncbi:MAG: hypothetical protein OES10_04980 [Gammaproteobacteria bacterium]|jgi:hypothetical protein|nr:hypothetical protein [Gammaproteobacteria bacterium]MDH3749996.1 hypothetical protein [Gammaproteobacteria bacterium]